jgi:hypothetical protein
MRTILASFELDAQRSTLGRTLFRELADVDGRMLLDIGLVRTADGTLHPAADPSQPIGPDLPWRRSKAILGGVAGLFRWLRSLPLRSPDWNPHFFLRE